MVTWLWLWGGSSFGYRAEGELRTQDGRHVGRFQGPEVYGLDGLYLGEVKRDGRLLVDLAKKSRHIQAFDPLPQCQERPSVFGFSSIPLPSGYAEFPRPSRL